MAQIYRPTYKANGKTKKVKKWYIRYRNHENKLVKVAGFTDKRATQTLAGKLENEADLVRKGLAEAPARHRERAIVDELKAFRDSLANKDVTDGQVDLVVGRCTRLVNGCGFGKSTGIDPVRVEE